MAIPNYTDTLVQLLEKNSDRLFTTPICEGLGGYGDKKLSSSYCRSTSCEACPFNTHKEGIQIKEIIDDNS